MSDLTINPLSVTVGRTSTAAAAQPQAPAKKIATPVTDVIDLSQPPTAEQAERLRNFGILGYGSVSAKGTVATTDLSNNVSVTHFTVDYQSEYFDLVHETTVRTSSTGIGVFTSGGSAYASNTSQLVCSWKDGSRLEAELRQSAYSFRMAGMPDWYVPSHQNADGSWSLAQFGPCPTTTVSGYHSVLTTVQSGGGQTQVSRYETAAYREVTTFPSQERPAGAVDYRNEHLDQLITQELLDRIGQDSKPLPLRRFDIQA